MSMYIVKFFYIAAWQILVIFYLCNFFTLFTKPHKPHECLIFAQLLWFILGGIAIKQIPSVTGVEFTLMIYAYPILLWLIQILIARKFFSLHQQDNHNNKKFLFLAISQIISMVLLNFTWIITLLIIQTYIT